MLRKRHVLIAQGLGEAVAKRAFEDFQDPKMRSSNFTWDLCRDWVPGQAESSLFMYFRFSTWTRFSEAHKTELKRITFASALTTIDALLLDQTTREQENV